MKSRPFQYPVTRHCSFCQPPIYGAIYVLVCFLFELELLNNKKQGEIASNADMAFLAIPIHYNAEAMFINECLYISVQLSE